MALKNYYDLLGIQSTASQDDIKQAFRKLSMKFHPDKNDGDAFLMEMFKNINEANEVLSNSGKRREYDRQLAGAEEITSTGTYTTSNDNAYPLQPTDHEKEQLYALWNQYSEKKQKADEAYEYIIRADNLDAPRYLTTKKVLSSIVLLLLLWLFLKPVAESTATNDRSSAYELVITETSKVYRKPNIQSEVIGEMALGDKVYLIDETNYFVKVEFTNSKGNAAQGYVRKSSVSLAKNN